MIPYEDLCQALDHYNRRLRGEDVPAPEYHDLESADDFDIVETADAAGAAVPPAMPDPYAEGTPDITAETAVPEADFGGGAMGSDQYGQPDPYAQSDQYAQAGYDSGAVPGAPAEQYGSDQYSSGQQAAAQYQEGYDQQQYQEGYDPQQAPAGAYPDDQDPNRQQ